MGKIVSAGFLLLLLITSSCGVNSNLMFRTPKGVEEQTDSIPLRPMREYQMSADDKFTFTLYTNGGNRIMENMAGMEKSANTLPPPEYLILTDGTSDLPVIGRVKVAGLTVQQAEDTLSKLYSKEYQKPFIQIKLTNQRVIVFPGNGSDAKVIPLQNNNTTLMEAIAQAGGIADRGKANRVKLMRHIGNGRVVYVLDLSTIEGLKYADMIVQANDYIYVEPSERLAQETTQIIAPVVYVLSSTLVIITVLLKLSK